MPFFFIIVPGSGKNLFAAMVSSYTSLVRKCCNSKGHYKETICLALRFIAFTIISVRTSSPKKMKRSRILKAIKLVVRLANKAMYGLTS